ncbi:response regulator [Kineosporia rhizophila]|jgi:two-component system chemotaxis response regulator CheY|uniref:response regulator n=1 Tax=Kineosporia TaxID=49184 RepID=UPI0006961A04|nr:MULTISPECIES: response regulator [Kineosporia]MCE0540012.1 response regulator [Kineosporia rhizophila]GLY14384.1 chemotaxis protein CheY [Kineosporia sp. NBRC 101677]
MQALVVDDSRVMRTILTKLLTNLNFDVVQAGDGAEALAALDAGARPEVALVDWNMPVMDGLTFIKKCRQNPEYRDVVLMMVTTESEQANIVRALAAGAHEYVIKPFTDEVIAEKLEMLGLIER